MVLALCFSSSFRFSWADTVDDRSSSAEVLEVVNVYYCPTDYVSLGQLVTYERQPATRLESPDGDVYYSFTVTPSKGGYDIYFELSEPVTLGSGDVWLSFATGDDAFGGRHYAIVNDLNDNSDYSALDVIDSSYSVSPFSYFCSIQISVSSSDVYSGKYICVRDWSAEGTLTRVVGSQLYLSDVALSEPPSEPGWDEEDGWLGSLIKAIIEGIQKIIDGITNLPENIANAVKGFFDMVVNAIVQLGQTIIDGLKFLFIPSDGYFEGVASDMQAWFEDHLGLLVYPFTLVADLASRIAAVEGGEPTAHIPEIAYTDGGDKYVLIAEQEVNLYEQVGRNETFIELHQLYLMAMDAAIGGALAFLAWKKFDQITGGSST